MVSVDSAPLSLNERVEDLVQTLENNNLQDNPKDVEVCKACGDRVNDNDNETKEDESSSDILVGNDIFHSRCFVCDHCGERLLGQFFFVDNGKYCESHKQVGLGSCGKCGDYLDENSVVVSGNSYHPKCFICFECQAPIIGKFYSSEEGSWLCENDWRMKQPRCGLCHLPILDRILSALDRKYHPACFTCATCDACLDGGQFVADTETDTVICRGCYIANKAPVCHKCNQAIVSEPGKRVTVVTCNGNKYHTKCYTCTRCETNLNGKQVFLESSNIVCKDCAGK